ncbi:ABC transporter ATP-binding protein [Myxococcota bacterium]|nr:ABC transporter ATP-binding protein [Myxococcota bacterium]
MIDSQVRREPAIQVEDLEYAFGEAEARKVVLDGIDLSLAAGEFAIMTGPSGSGKTTLLSLIGALRSPQQGGLRVLGRDLSRLGAARGGEAGDLEAFRRRLGIIFQLHNLFPALTAFQSVQMSLDLHDLSVEEKDARIEGILAKLGLEERFDYKPERLSGGQRQRVAIARALVHEPELVLADEPTAALDAENTEIVLELLRELARKRRTSVLMVTQDARVFEAADRLVHLVDGRIVSDVQTG